MHGNCYELGHIQNGPCGGLIGNHKDIRLCIVCGAYVDVINPLMNSGFRSLWIFGLGGNIKGFSSHSHLTFLTRT